MKTPNLRHMLTYRRPAGSATEDAFIARYIDTIPGIIVDEYGNRILICEGSKTMISCHTDTVHRVAGMQSITSKKGIISLAKNERISNCLGADDTAGIYAALRMIQAGVKATFIFHRDEEIGGKGSAWLAKNCSGWLSSFDRCIALDRRGIGDIITHQAFGRCCSDTFANSLALQLDMGHKRSDMGIFTDSANYVGIIQECTNVSVGYYNEHSVKETLDTVYLERLINQLIVADLDSLPTCEWVDDTVHWSYTRYSDTPIDTGVEFSGDCEYCGDPHEELYVTDENMLVCGRCYRWFEMDRLDELEARLDGCSAHAESQGELR